MFVRQLSVFLENTTGSLTGFTKTLKDNGIDLKAMSIADTMDFGIARCIVEDPEKTAGILQQNGYNTTITKVLAAEMRDIPGGLHAILEILSDHGIAVNYAYSIVRSREDYAVIILKVKDPQQAGELLQSSGVNMYCHKDLI
ncbi:MAG: hypothetical protein ACOX41_04180 [Anaerovoracaceae bacterium]|jgi:hypothetical protein